jgi:hypothetical protein
MTVGILIEPPLVLVGLLQEWIQKKALFTVNRIQAIRDSEVRATVFFSNKKARVKYFKNGSPLNRIQAMVPLTATLFGVFFLRGHISLKNWTYWPLLRESATPYQRTCLLIRLKEVPDALYGPHLQR